MLFRSTEAVTIPGTEGCTLFLLSILHLHLLLVSLSLFNLFYHLLLNSDFFFSYLLTSLFLPSLFPNFSISFLTFIILSLLLLFFCFLISLPSLIHLFIPYYFFPHSESLYNISKVARTSVLKYFNSVFDGLCKLFLM